MLKSIPSARSRGPRALLEPISTLHCFHYVAHHAHHNPLQPTTTHHNPLQPATTQKANPEAVVPKSCTTALQLPRLPCNSLRWMLRPWPTPRRSASTTSSPTKCPGVAWANVSNPDSRYPGLPSSASHLDANLLHRVKDLWRPIEDGSTTQHRLAVIESLLPPQTSGPVFHFHEMHDEGFYVTVSICTVCVRLSYRIDTDNPPTEGQSPLPFPWPARH